MPTDAATLLEDAARLEPGTRAALDQAGHHRRCEAGAYLFLEGDAVDSVFLVRRGLLRVERNLISGRRVLLTLTGPGTWMGQLAAFDNQPRSATAAAVVTTDLLAIPAPDFVALIRGHADLADDLLRWAAARMRTLTDQLVEAAAGSAAARVAARLIELSAMIHPNVDGPVEIRLPITQEELAQWAGLSREGAVGGLRELREAGLIETGRMRVTLLEPARLARVAGDLV